MKSEKFPLSIRRGSCTVKIYRDKTKASGTYYRVSFYMGAKRCGLNFSNLDKAKQEAAAKAAQLSRGDLDALHITGRDRHVYGRALEAIKDLDVPLDAAAAEYADAKRLLGGFSMSDAVRFYLSHHARGITAKPVGDAVAEMIAAKGEKGVSKVYLADLRYHLGALATAFHCNVNAVVPDDLRKFLDSHAKSARGYNNRLTALHTFFGFAQDRGWLSKDVNVVAGIERRKAKAAPVEIFTPAEMAEIFAHCSMELKPCLALGAFAGLRTEEILRLDWSDVERRPGFIEIAADKAKTAARRLVPVTPNLAQWLAVSGGDAGRVWAHCKRHYFKSLRDTVQMMNESRKPKARQFAWKDNALRHSFISYRLAEVQDTNRVALEAGNSPRMIFQHYRELVTPAEAKTWFSLVPDEASNVITLKSAR